MATKYYTNLHEIDDKYRKKKYLTLLISSLQNDMSKWTETVMSDKSKYTSPKYGGSSFCVEIRTYSSFAYVMHTNPPIPDHHSELISESFGSELNNAVEKLRENIYTPEIYEIEKLVGKQHSRKEKLDALELEQVKEMIDDTFKDWTNNPSEITARMIAKIMYSYRKDEEIYNLWLDVFNNNELIMSELKKIKG